MPAGKGTKQMTDLLQAVSENNISNVRQLVQELQITTKRRDQRNSPFACMSGRSTPTERTEFESLVLEASKQKDVTILKHFLELGATVNFTCRMESTNNAPTNIKQVSPLHVAIESENDNVIDAILTAGANVNVKDSEGRTPLHYTAAQCDAMTTRQLLFRGAHAAVTDNCGTTPLQIAAKYGHVELIRILLEHDAQVFQRGQKGFSALHIAASQGHVPLLDMFCRNIDVNIRSTSDPCKEAKTALHLACANGLYETVRFLIDRFAASVDITDNSGRAPLHCVLQKKHDFRKMRRKDDFDNIVEFLIKKNAQIDSVDNMGNTPLYYAAKNQYHKTADLLLMSGANPDHRNKKNQSPRDVIEEYDATMTQIFLRNSPFTSSYLSLVDDAEISHQNKCRSVCLNDNFDIKEQAQIYKTVIQTS